MADFDKTNRGSIWKNDKKTQDSHPDFTGKQNIEGVWYFVDAWKRKEGSSDRAPALSWKLKRMDKQPSISQRAMPKRDPISSGSFRHDDMNDDVPFAPETRG